MPTLSRAILTCAALLPPLLACTPCRAKGQQKPPIRMALSIRNISWVEPVSAKAVAATVIEEIGRRTGYSFSIDMFKSADKMVEQLASGEYNVGIAGALEYVQITPKVDVIPISREFRLGSPSFKILLLVRKDAGIEKIADLKGKKLSLADDDPINKVYLQVLLARSGIKQAGFFSEVKVKTKPKAAVLDLFLQEADACLSTDNVFYSMAKLNPQLKRRLRPIHYSESISNGAIFVRKDLSDKLKRGFTEVLMDLHNTEKGKQLLKIFRTTKVVSVTDGDYASVRKIWKEYQDLAQRR